MQYLASPRDLVSLFDDTYSQCLSENKIESTEQGENRKRLIRQEALELIAEIANSDFGIDAKYYKGGDILSNHDRDEAPSPSRGLNVLSYGSVLADVDLYQLVVSIATLAAGLAEPAAGMPTGSLSLPVAVLGPFASANIREKLLQRLSAKIEPYKACLLEYFEEDEVLTLDQLVKKIPSDEICDKASSLNGWRAVKFKCSAMQNERCKLGKESSLAREDLNEALVEMCAAGLLEKVDEQRYKVSCSPETSFDSEPPQEKAVRSQRELPELSSLTSPQNSDEQQQADSLPNSADDDPIITNSSDDWFAVISRKPNSVDEFYDGFERLKELIQVSLDSSDGQFTSRYTGGECEDSEPEDNSGWESDYKEACLFVEALAYAMTKHCGTITAIVEFGYIDASHRDAYYNYYSLQYFETPRFSTRVSFFKGELDSAKFRSESIDKLTELFLGSTVLNPLGEGVVGKTLLSASCLIDNTAYLRLTEFSVNVRSRQMKVRAFPYRKQDGHAIRCAQAVLLNIMSYYSNEYPDYGRVLPSDIIETARTYSFERMVPSRGLTYEELTRLLAAFGFHPRLYSKAAVLRSATPSESHTVETNNLESLSQQVKTLKAAEGNFRRLLCRYLSSGIPVAIDVGNESTHQSHSVVAIGYTKPEAALSTTSFDELKYDNDTDGCLIRGESGKEIIILNAEDTIKDFVLMDDGQLPYAARPYNQPCAHLPEFKPQHYAVPLHKGMNLDANDAYNCFLRILKHEQIGILQHEKTLIDNKSVIVMEIRLASSRRFRRFRCEEESKAFREIHQAIPRLSGNRKRKAESIANNKESLLSIYEEMIFPHFIWIASLYCVDDFVKEEDGRKIFAEIILDATAGEIGNPADKIVSMRYPNSFVFSDPDSNYDNASSLSLINAGDDTALVALLPDNGCKLFSPFIDNLQLIKPL